MKLQFGMVGGGNGAFIGDVHRRGATMDNLAVLSAGCFSRNMQKNKENADLWNVQDKSRVYATWQDMVKCEAKREDQIDFVSIVTPTGTHFEIAKAFLEAGISVVCDKPICLSSQEGVLLQEIADKKGLSFGVTYTYASYAVIRQAREMLREGCIGRILKVEAEYPQEWVLFEKNQKTQKPPSWRLNPVEAGTSACCSDIGTHLEALISKMTGLSLRKVLARFTTYADSSLDHDIDVLLEFEGQIPGHLWASQLASGHDCDVKIRVFGDCGAIEWKHTSPMEMIFAPLGQPIQILTANKPYAYAQCTDQCRLPAGHPEGFYEAFGNVYRNYCKELLAKKQGESTVTYEYPRIEDGIAGLRFVEACLESNAKGNVWTMLAGE